MEEYPKECVHKLAVKNTMNRVLSVWTEKRSQQLSGVRSKDVWKDMWDELKMSERLKDLYLGSCCARRIRELGSDFLTWIIDPVPW